MTVEVFKTNVQGEQIASKVRMELLQLFPDCKINFDLDDCDRILRVESAMELRRKIEIEEEMSKRGFICEELP